MQDSGHSHNVLDQFWSGNFHQLKKNLGKSSFELLKLHNGLTPGKYVDARRFSCRTSITKVEGSLKKPTTYKPCNVNTRPFDEKVGSTRALNATKSELHEDQDFQYYNIQKTVLENRIYDRPCILIAFDIETSGFSPKYDSIIEIAARDLCGGKNSTFETLVNPNKRIMNTDVHGISTGMVNNPDTPRFEELIPIFLQFVRSRQVDGKPVAWIAHNGRRFDVPFFIKEFNRCSVEIPSDWVFIDTLPLARQLLMPDGSKCASASLEALRLHYGIPLLDQRHRAMQDVTTLCHVFPKITFDLKMTVQELLDVAFRTSDLTKVSH